MYVQDLCLTNENSWKFELLKNRSAALAHPISKLINLAANESYFPIFWNLQKYLRSLHSHVPYFGTGADSICSNPSTAGNSDLERPLFPRSDNFLIMWIYLKSSSIGRWRNLCRVFSHDCDTTDQIVHHLGATRTVLTILPIGRGSFILSHTFSPPKNNCDASATLMALNCSDALDRKIHYDTVHMVILHMLSHDNNNKKYRTQFKASSSMEINIS